MEVKGLMSVGALAKHPCGPAPGGSAGLGIVAWVLYSESHYSVLFSKGTGPASLAPKSALRPGGDAVGRFAGFPEPDGMDPVTCDVWYFDQQGQQREEIRLTVSVDKMPLPARRADAVVPFVDAMLRTIPQWAEARVNWNGAEPLL
jgi:hypothetical protein